MSEAGSKSRWTKWLPDAAILVVWVSSVLGVVWAASADRSDIVSHVNANTAQVADHEARLRVLEKQIGEIATDVRWIRQTLEHPRNPRSQ